MSEIASVRRISGKWFCEYEIGQGRAVTIKRLYRDDTKDDSQITMSFAITTDDKRTVTHLSLGPCDAEKIMPLEYKTYVVTNKKGVFEYTT